MERYVLGLNLKNSSDMLKNNTKEACTDSVTGVQWPFSNKVTSRPQLMSFKAAQEDKQRRNVYNDPPTSSVSLPVLTSYAFDLNSKPPASFAKKNMDVSWKFPASIDPLVNGGITITGRNLDAAPMKQQRPLGGLANSFINGTTDIRKGAKTSRAPSQFTIFYADAVHVYDNLSPEKAEAIMFLAGNGSCMSADIKPTSKPVAKDNDSTQPQPHQIVNSLQTMPLAPRASLARFLEKRKDRLKNAMPYNLIRNRWTAPPLDPNNLSFSVMQQGAIP